MPAEPGGSQPARRWRWYALAILFGYVASVAGYFWLDSSSMTVQPENLQAGDETVVLLEMTAIHPVDNTIDVNVLVIPARTLTDTEFGVLNTDLAVRLYPSSDFGELNYARGRMPGRESTSMVAFGDADRWPFDSFTTGTISADVLAGSAQADADGPLRYVPARVEIDGSLNGWDITGNRTAPTGEAGPQATVELSRSRGPLLLIGGYCLVLLALPAIAWFVALELLIGRKTFQPAFSTWFAAMLFSVIPIRTVLPGSPPAGSWVDEAITVWVLIALTAAMAVYVLAWVRRAE